MVKIAIVAGEASGDLLGAGLIEALRARLPDARFEGIAGPAMEAAGCQAWYPAERLSVMGLVEVLGRLPELLRIRRDLFQRLRRNPPDVFIGIDAPDFNLALERRLRAAGIPTVHYVSPSVWAWRQRRVRKIARSVDLMLTLFPFEADFYRRHGVEVRFVGHPLADMIPLQVDRAAARQHLGIDSGAKVVALLPGSRMGEVARLAGCMLSAAALCARVHPELQFIAPLATPNTRALFEREAAAQAPGLALRVLSGQSREVMAAADVVLLASGTAALEALLLKRPMVVTYRLSALTFWILKHLKMIKVPFYSLPNLLAGREVAPELVQDQATPEALSQAVLRLLDQPQASREMEESFLAIHESLRRDASASAAEAVAELIASRGTKR
jgi:lipid-A-disaccharide synthase